MPVAFCRGLERERISLLHTVPTLAQSKLAGVPVGVSQLCLRLCFNACEPLTHNVVRKWRGAFPQAGKIVNLYGPTETAQALCFCRHRGDILPGVQPVGEPLAQRPRRGIAGNPSPSSRGK